MPIEEGYQDRLAQDKLDPRDKESWGKCGMPMPDFDFIESEPRRTLGARVCTRLNAFLLEL